MAKINFTKVEKSLNAAKEKAFIENLNDLATIANAIQANLNSEKELEKIIDKFQHELKHIKKHLPNLYEKLNLTAEEEIHFNLPYKEYTQTDWQRIIELKSTLEKLKADLQDQIQLQIMVQKDLGQNLDLEEDPVQSMVQAPIKILEQEQEQQDANANVDPVNKEIIAKEREKHINKRFNVKKGWLPLK